MKLQRKLKVKKAVILLLLLSFGINSCKKSKSNETTDTPGKVKVTIRMLGVDENSEPLATNSTGNGKLAVNSEKIQTKVVPFNKDYVIKATLVPEGMAAGSEANGGLSTNATQPKLKLAAIPDTTLLGANVKYRVLVYDAAGAYVISKDYAYSNETTVGDFELDAGKTYTFIAYSYNSTTDALPDQFVATTPAGASELLKTRLNFKVGDLMYFRTQLVLNSGPNNLNIVLKHMNTQITTNINLLAPAGTRIEGVGNIGTLVGGSAVKISPSTASSGIWLGTGAVFYSNPDGTTPPAYTNIDVAFPAITSPGVTTITSTPTIVYHPGTTTAQWLGNIAIAGIVKTVTIGGLSINPGVKYNLNLTINALTGVGSTGCTAEYPFTSFGNAPEISFTNPSIISQARSYVNNSTTEPGTFNKAIFYITSLNYGFTMTYSSPPLFANTSGTLAQFLLDNVSSPLARTIQFEDGTQYGVGSVPHLNTLSNVSGSTTGPVIQLEIDAAGNVSMYGIKTSGTSAGLAPLYKLVAAPGFHFNTLPTPWNPSTSAVPVNSYGIGLSTAAGYPSNNHITAHAVVVKNIACTN